MILKFKTILIVLFCFQFKTNLIGQEKHYFQSDFLPKEFELRRAKIFDEIGANSIALIQSAPTVAGFKVFRQTNTFYYLSGLEEGHAYLLMNGKNKTATIYLPHREEGREKSQGKILAAEDSDLIKELTGVDRVRAIEYLGNDLVRTGLIKGETPLLFTPFSPAEIGNDSRDEILNGHARAAADPWDSNSTREARLKISLNERFPCFCKNIKTGYPDGIDGPTMMVQLHEVLSKNCFDK